MTKVSRVLCTTFGFAAPIHNDFASQTERNATCTNGSVMDIHVVSTLTIEDEDRMADALVAALAELLDGLPIAYALRIETSGAKVLQRTNLEAMDSQDPRGATPDIVQ